MTTAGVYQQGPISVVLEISAAEINTAATLDVRCEATVESGYRVRFPQLSGTVGGFRLLAARPAPPEPAGAGRTIYRQSYELEPFLAGTYTLPPLEIAYVKGARQAETVRTAAVPIRVLSVLPRERPVPPMRDIAGGVRPAPSMPWPALAAARLRDAESDFVRSKVVLLLTDGENNAGSRPVAEAARIAAGWGVRVYAIAVRGKTPPRRVRPGAPRLSGGSEFLLPDPHAGEDALKLLASSTGGLYRSVEAGKALEAVCTEIDGLEKSELPRTRIERAYDLFPFLLGAGTALLALEILLSCTWLRRAP